MKITALINRILTTILLIGFVFSCRENTINPVYYGTLKGTITFEQNGSAAKNAAISTVPSTNISYSDSLGNYVLDSIPVGYYTLVATLDGYNTASAPAQVAQGITSKIDLVLTPQVADPNEPELVAPANNKDSVARNVTLTWTVKNEIKDQLTYDIVVYEGNQTSPLAEYKSQTDTFLVLSNLRFETKYYWQVITKNSLGLAKNGALWNFRTAPFPSNRFLFSSARNGTFAVFSSDSSGADLIQLTASSAESVYPRYSHDRRTIAYSSLINLDYQIMLMDHDGTNPRQVSSLPIAGNYNQGGGFSWSPDDGKILYSHFDKLYTMDQDGGNLTAVATAPAGRNFRKCDWSAFNTSVVAETVGVLPYDNEIVLVDIQTGTIVTLIGNLPGTIQSPSFSINGQQILYTRDVSGFQSPDGRQLNSHIFIYDIATGVNTDISTQKPPGTNDLNPRFSPTGAQVIFEHKLNDNSGPTTIWILEISDSSRKQVFSDASMPDWR